MCGMKGVHQSSARPDLQFGIISKEQLPKSYRLVEMASIIGNHYQLMNNLET